MLRARTAKKDFTALPLTECLAKTYRNAHGVTAAGRTVLDHALITGAVAALLLERLPKCTLPFYPEGVDRIVSAHDVGKVCPTFQHKIHQAAGSLGTFPELADADPSLEQDWRGHASHQFRRAQGRTGQCIHSSDRGPSSWRTPQRKLHGFVQRLWRRRMAKTA